MTEMSKTARKRVITLVAAAAFMGAAALTVAVRAALTPPDLSATVRRLPYPDDTPAHQAANIAWITAAIGRAGAGNPEASDAYYQLGYAQWRRGRYAEAAAAFDCSLALPPGPATLVHFSAYEMKFEALQMLCRYREALAMVANPPRDPYSGRRLVVEGGSAAWLAELTEEADARDDADGLKQQLSALAAAAPADRTPAGDRSAALIGLLVRRGRALLAYTPDGRLIESRRYLQNGGNAGPAMMMTSAVAGSRAAVPVEFVVRLSHPPRQAVDFAWCAAADPPSGSFSGAGGESPSLQNGVLVTDEQALNRQTCGLRVFGCRMPADARAYRLMVGIAAAPAGPDAARAIADMGSPPDRPGILYSWSTFAGIRAPLAAAGHFSSAR